MTICIGSRKGYILLLTVGLVMPSYNQGSSQSGLNNAAPPMPTPSCVGVARGKDATSVQMIQSFLSQSFSETLPEESMEGTLSIGDPSLNRSFPAVLILAEGRRFRLEVASPKEQDIRILGAEKASSTGLGMRRATSKGPFGVPFLSGESLFALIAEADISLNDRGYVTIGGINLHRVTVMRLSRSPLEPTSCGDLYFNAQNKMLSYSSTVEVYPSRPSASFTRTITYDDYSAVSGLTIAHRFTESNNGAIGMTFAAKQTTLSTLSGDTTFHF